jgi:hypothetical protein
MQEITYPATTVVAEGSVLFAKVGLVGDTKHERHQQIGNEPCAQSGGYGPRPGDRTSIHDQANGKWCTG